MRRLGIGLFVVVTLFCGFSFADSAADNIGKLFVLIADPKSTVDDVKASLAENPVPLDTTYESQTPLIWALRQRKIDIFNYFYTKMGSPDVNSTMDGSQMSIYEVAVLNADWPTILDLRKKGGHLKTKQDEFVSAAAHNTIDVIQHFLDEGAKVNQKSSRGDLALLEAVSSNTIDVVKLLLKAGANVNLKNPSGYTALLSFVSMSSDVDKYNLLLQAGADIHVQSKFGDTVLSLAARHWPIPFLKSLIDQGLKINAGTQTALMSASEYASVETVKFLLENGANVNSVNKNRNGQTALHYATFNKCNVDVINTLISAGAIIDAANTEGITPLMTATVVSCPQVIAALISRGAQVNHADKEGDTALHFAVCRRHGAESIQVIQALLAAGADSQKKNSNHLTPYEKGINCRAPKEVLDLLRTR